MGDKSHLFFHHSLFFSCLILSFFSCQNTQTTIEKPPNVLLILTDDQGYGDIGIHGNDSIDTPVQDRLAQQGTRMDNFYVSPVCAPTRASLLTGRYHYRTGVNWVTRNAEAMRTNEVTIAEVLKANGYATGCFGKWHNGAHYPENPNGQGFDTFTGFCGGHWNRYINPTLEVNGKMIETKGYINDIVTDSASQFIARQINQEQPFFAYLPYNTPHTPFVSPDSLFQKYKQKGLTDEIASTYGMVENIDQNIGRLLEQLESAEVLENTIVIFLTDNGPNFNRYNGGMKGRKGWINDGGVRVPCFIYWKGHLEGGRVAQQLTSHIDILPTLSDLLNLKRVQTLPLDGISFASLLQNKTDSLPQRTLFTFAIEGQQYKGSVRTQQYRLTITGEDDYQLTQLLEDPSEQRDLKEKYPDIAANLYQQYLAKYEEVTQGLEQFPPLPMGYDVQPVTELHAHEGFFTGSLAYKTAHWGWCNDWFTNWTSPQDTMFWKVNIAEASDYKVIIKYACTDKRTLENPFVIQAKTSQLKGQLEKPFKGQFIDDYEQVPRVVEADEYTWATQEIGMIQLQKGSQRIELYSEKIPPNAAVKSLIFEKVSL